MKYTEDQLAELAFEAEDNILHHELEEARKIGQTLIEAEKEYGYQVMAMASQAEQDLEGALSWIRQGMEKFPESWTLGMQLGNVYSEHGKAKTAILAFDKAKRMPNADKALIDINKAVAYVNAQDLDEALNTLQGLKDTEKAIEAFEVKLSILSQIGKFDLLKEIAQEELADLPIPKNKDQATLMSEICTHIAKAIWFTDEEEEAIVHYLEQAKEYDRTNGNICWLQREMEPEFSDDSVLYSLLVEGKSLKPIEAIHPESKEKVQVNHFQNTYMVIADSEEEALEYVYAYEQDMVEKESLEIVNVEFMENEDDEPKGLYMLGEMDWMMKA